MLTYEDCLALSDLTEEEVAAIAEHEHIPAVVATALGSYLVHSPDGVPMLRKIIVEDIEQARAAGDRKHALELKMVLRHFVENHPDAPEPKNSDGLTKQPS